MATCDLNVLKRLQENAQLSAKMVAGALKDSLSDLQQQQVTLLTKLQLLEETPDHYPFVGEARIPDHK